jgi:prepilin-type N-terminal cleavage/methylation domain-containing protein
MNPPTRGYNHRGFTLVELLVVISIIGSLSSIALTSFTSVRGKARDAIRLQYIRQINEAITQYTWDNAGRYPPQDDPGNGGGGTLPWGYNYSYDPGFISALVTKKYISQTPRDPVNSPSDGLFFWYLNNSGNVGGVPMDPVKQANFMALDCANPLTVKAVLMFSFEGGPNSQYTTAPSLPTVNTICYK